jgi:hypothetical protein
MRTFSWVIRGFPPPEWVMDATKPWKCPDNYWDGIFTEHVLEHLAAIMQRYGGPCDDARDFCLPSAGVGAPFPLLW